MSENPQHQPTPDCATFKVRSNARPSSSGCVPKPFEQTLVSDRVVTRLPASAPVVFPSYEILDELGRGGMGVVYKARQRNLNRLVALKVILGGPLASVEDKARFRVEAEAAARLTHPNIVQVYDVGEYAGFSYIALELIEGPTLRHWQNGQPVNPQQAARIVSSIGRAIQHAHEQGIIHRDLKPANILLSPVAVVSSQSREVISETTHPLPAGISSRVGGKSSNTETGPLLLPKVTDFGLAKAIEGRADLTITGVACGTPNYMAPEQVRGKKVSTAVDVYGLGTVLFELLTGRPPFVGSDPSDVMNQVLRTEPPNVRKLVRGVPRDLAVIVDKCLQKDPARRYLTACDVADDLDRFLSGRPIAARPISVPERVLRWVKRNPVVSAFLVLSTLGCAVTTWQSLALARSESQERAARAEADCQRLQALRARDELQKVLTAVEMARQTAEQERAEAAKARDEADAARKAADVAREIAMHEADRAIEQKQLADAQKQAAIAARLRAEDNLRIARGVIRISLRDLSNHPRFEDEEFREVRTQIIRQSRSFRDTVATQAPDTAEWLDDLADVSHWLGYLEYLNGNHLGAAAEYRTAAAAAGRWAVLEPNNPLPRARQAFSLENAGNALYNARDFKSAEQCYRDATRLIDGVVVESPQNAFYRRQAIQTYSQLANVLRVTDQTQEWKKVAKTQLDRVEELMEFCGKTVDNQRLHANALVGYAQALARRTEWDAADKHYAAAIEVRMNLKVDNPTMSVLISDLAATRFQYASFLAQRGKHDHADQEYLAVITFLEEERTNRPNGDFFSVELAIGYTRYGEFLHARSKFAYAERMFNRALDLLKLVLRHSPGSRSARNAWVGAVIGCARVYNHTNRHREAAAEWALLAVEDPNVVLRPRHELFAIQSLLFAKDWKRAVAAVDIQLKKDQPGWMWVDLALVLCNVAKQASTDPTLTPAERLCESESALAKALMCLEKARAVGEFENPDRLRWYNTNSGYDLIRSRFNPFKK